MNRNFGLFFLPLTVFTKELGMVWLAGIQFDFISYPFFVFSFLVFAFSNQLQLGKNEYYFFLFLFFQGILGNLVFQFPFIIFLKQFVPILLIYFVCNTIIKTHGPSVVFENYVFFSYYAAIIGVIQILLKLINIKFLTPYSGFFIDSVALEPSHYLAIIIPAGIYMYERKFFNYKFWIILITIILTFKLTALGSLLIYFIFKNRKFFKKLFIVGPFIIIAFYYVIQEIPSFLDRVEGFQSYYSDGDLSKIDNLTTYSFISNFEVAKNNFLNSYGLGVGLGGHVTSYFNYFPFPVTNNLKWHGINSESGHSLAIRVFSEIGIVGILFFFFVIKKIILLPRNENKIIVIAALSHFIVKIFKLGGYFDYGTLFFLTIILVVFQYEKLIDEIARVDVVVSK